MLFNKAQTELLGIPWNQTEVIVPDTVETIVLESGNSIQTLLLKGQTVPEIDLSLLENVEITVPADMYETYMLAWGSRLGTNQLNAGEDMDQILENDAILSSDRKKLFGITSTAYGLYEVPDTVTTIKEGATKACRLEEGLYLPEGITSLEKDSLSGEGIQTIYFTGDTPPEVEEGVFGELAEAAGRGLQIVVLSGCRDAWVEAWSGILGDEVQDLIVEEEFSLVEEDGLRYLLTDSWLTGNIFLHAPAETMSFEELEEKAGGDVTWSRIGTRAFEDCQELSAIELPMSVESIGSEAFLACKNLDLLLSQCVGVMELGEDPFPHGSSAAFNAGSLMLQDPGMLEYVSIFATYTCWVMDSEWNFYDVNLWGTSYRLEEAEEEGWFLFGIDWNENYEPISYLVGVSRDMTGPIRGAEDCPLRQIGYYTFMDHEPEFWIPEEVGRQLEFVNPYAFYNSGLSGTVTLSKGMFRVDNYAFASCKNLKEVRFDAETDYDEWNVQIKENVFSRSGVERIVFSENTSFLQSGTFYRCDHLKELVFTGAEPPELSLFSVGAGYLWGWEDNDQIPEILLEGDAEGEEEAYIESWMYAILGYDSRDSMESEFWMEAFQNIVEVLDEEQAMDWQYVDDYIAAKSELAEYEARKILNPLFGLDEPEKPEVEIPKIEDYLYEEIEEELPFEVLPLDEIVINPDQVEIDKDFLIDDLPDGEEPGGDSADDEKQDDADADGKTDEKPDDAEADGKTDGKTDDAEADGKTDEKPDDVDADGKTDGKTDDADTDGETDKKPDGDAADEDKKPSGDESDGDGSGKENADKDDSSKDGSDTGDAGSSDASDKNDAEKDDKENGSDSSGTDEKGGETGDDKAGSAEQPDSDAE